MLPGRYLSHEIIGVWTGAIALITVSDQVILALIAAIVPTLTIMLQWRQQNKKITQVHEIVNSKATIMEDEVKKLKAEIAKLNAGGPLTPVTQEVPSPVTMLDGIVSVESPPPVGG